VTGVNAPAEPDNGRRHLPAEVRALLVTRCQGYTEGALRRGYRCAAEITGG
jgi:hypothetical protein